MPTHRGTELVKETMQRSPLFQEDLDFPLLFHFAPGADYEGAVPLRTRWHINLYYVQKAPGQYPHNRLLARNEKVEENRGLLETGAIFAYC